ncbi:MAG: putative phage abortive infection protein [Gelidibacter sp.]
MKGKTLTYQWIIGTISALFIFITTLIIYVKGHINRGDINFTKLGTFGDFIGGLLGTILSIVAVILVYRTYISQKEELSMSRNLLEQQQFENTFFNMLKVHQDLKSNISFNTNNLITKNYALISMTHHGRNLEQPFDVRGRDFFISLSKDFERLFKHFPHDNPNYSISAEIDEKLEKNGFGINFRETTYRDDIKEIKFKYDLIFENYAIYLGDYFRNLYHILKFISTKKKAELKNVNQSLPKIEIEDKFKQYADILQSQMNFSELQLTFYNCFKFRKLRKLVKEFDFVENLHSSNLFSEEHLKFKSIGKIKTK